MVFKTALLTLVLGSFTLPSALAGPVGGDPNYCDKSGKCSDYYEAVDFLPLGSLDARLIDLLLRAEIDYDIWVQNNDSEAATFLALTHALTLMEVKVGKDQWVPFIALIKKVNEFLGDRVYYQLDHGLFSAWYLGNKGEFRIVKANGKSEKGKFKFVYGGSGGGSLHKGYDIQASTSIKDVPRIQINYRFSDNEADIDIDGYAPWKWGVIPNPNHLTYENSDVRQWFSNYVKKFGDPGFRARPH